MGVIDKIKGRMSGYNALTKGPSKAAEFDTMGFDSGRERTKGSDTVAAGLAAGSAAAPPQEKNMGAEIAEVGSTIGKAIGAAAKDKDVKPSERREFIDNKKEDGATGKEARVAYREKKEGAKIINKYLKENPIGFIKI
jgi:hypothetical protein